MLAGIPPERQDFLLRTALLDRLERRTGVWIGADDASAILELARAVVPSEVLSFAADTLALLKKREGRDAAAEVLSERELAVLRLIVAGHSNEEIARALFIAVGTVKKHTHNIYEKLGVRRRTAAVREARAQGLLVAEQE